MLYFDWFYSLFSNIKSHCRITSECHLILFMNMMYLTISLIHQMIHFQTIHLLNITWSCTFQLGFDIKKYKSVIFTPITYHDNLCLILLSEEQITSKLNILTTFQPITWWLLILFLIIYSLINVNSKRNFLFSLIISMFDQWSYWMFIN